VKPVGESVKPPKQRDSQFSIRPIRKDIVPVKQKDSYSSVEPVHEDTAPAKQADSLALAETPYENTAPVEPAHSQIENPVHADSDLTQQTDSHFVLGVRSGLSEKYAEAIEELSAAVEEDPASAVAHTSLGVALHRAEQDDRALASYEAALTINPQYAEAHYFRANILYERGDIRGAIAGYTMAVGLDPELIEAHRKPVPQDRLTDYTGSPAKMYWIARSAHRILDLNKSLEQNPRQANLLKERAAQYYRLWNYEQTIADYSASLKIQPDDANALHLRGLAYEQMGQQGRALEDYQQAIHLNPQLSDLYINRGVTFGKMGNLRQSISSLSEGIRLAPKNPDGYFNRGVTYFQGGDFERAVDDFSSVILLSPNDDAAYYWRGVSNEEAGRQREAIADYKQFLKLSQDPGAKAEIEQRLSQWNEAPQNRVNRRDAAPNDRQRTIQVESKKSEHKPDLYDLIAALGERALNSIWFGAGVNCSGEKAEELYASTDHNRPIQGRDLLQITSGIQQTIEGDFTGFDPDATSHWIFIRAWQGNGFYVETNGPTSKQRLKGRFPSAEDVTDVEHPYEGLFISI
jgi:tetratricopeptide (TPR) repeat protein